MAPSAPCQQALGRILRLTPAQRKMALVPAQHIIGEDTQHDRRWQAFARGSAGEGRTGTYRGLCCATPRAIEPRQTSI